MPTSPDFRLGDWLPVAAAERVALRTRGHSLDHRAFVTRTEALSAAIVASGARAAALHYADAADFAVALYACWHAGCAVTLPGNVLPATVAAMHRDVELLVGEWPGVTAALSPTPNRLPGTTRAGPLPYALRVFTSGSTGDPQQIDKTLTELREEVASIQALLAGSVTAATAVTGTVSHQHYYGLVFRILWPLASGLPVCGGTVRYPEELTHPEGAAPCVLVSSPAFLKHLGAPLPGVAGNWALILSAGSPLDRITARTAMSATGAPLCEIYGSTETGAVAARWGDSTPWNTLPGVSVRAGADDRLEVRGPKVPDDRWLQSADRVRLHSQGFELLGRADRLVKVSDKRVSLRQLEASLCRSRWVLQARSALLAGDRAELGAAVVLSPEGIAELRRVGPFKLGRQLRQTLADSFDPATAPRRFRFVDELPVDALGKTRDAELLALFARRRTPTVLTRTRQHGGCILTLYIDPALACFTGHFPGFPIVPGLFQVEWAVRFGQQAFLIPGDFTGIDMLKFHRIIGPDTTLQLRLDWEERGMLSFRYETTALCSRGRILLTAAAT